MHIHVESSRECHGEISRRTECEPASELLLCRTHSLAAFIYFPISELDFLGLGFGARGLQNVTPSNPKQLQRLSERSTMTVGGFSGNRVEGGGGRSFVVTRTECIDYYFPQPISPLSHVNRAAAQGLGVNYQRRLGSRNRSHLSKPRCLSCRTGRFPRD